jgi:hypothetical protein
MARTALRLPRGRDGCHRLQFLSPAVTAFVTFALIGFYAALIPNFLAESLHEESPLVSGAVVFELFTAATLTTILMGSVTIVSQC